MTPAPRHIPRRRFLQAGAALAAAGLLPGAALPRLDAPQRRTKRVVLVVFGGGVRTRETVGSGNTPNLDRLAARGVLVPRVAVRNLGHFGATLAILTGTDDSYGIRENASPAAATLFERLRKATGLGPMDVWLATTGLEQETNYAASRARGFGPEYGANLIGAEGVFNEDFRALAAANGELPEPDPEGEVLMRELRAGIRTPVPYPAGAEAALNDDATSAAIEAYILEELRGGASAITGLGAEDAKALHVARALFASFRPTLLGVTLRTADVAHSSFNDYVTIIRRNDEEIGKLMDRIESDELLREETALFVLPEFGRDRDFNGRRGLDHGDGSQELNRVALVAAGPDFKRGAVLDDEVASTDVAPAILELLGAERFRGRGPLAGLYAEG